MNIDQPQERPVKKRRSGVVVPHKVAWHGELASFLIFAMGRSLEATWRMRVEDEHNLLTSNFEPSLFAIWHNRLAISMAAWRQFISKRSEQARLAALISASKDGALLARTLERFDVQPVRGSSSRRGAQALLELTGWVEKGCDIAITPDGPRGPKYRVQEGIIALAQVTGRAIIPVGASFSSKACLKSWDQFQVPYPFSKCVLRIGEAMSVARDLNDAQREQARLELEQRLRLLNPD